MALDLEDARRAFPAGYRVSELRHLALYFERDQRNPIDEDEVGRWARRILLASGSIGAFELLTRLSQGIHHGFVYRRQEAKGVQLPVETLRLGHGSCRDFAMLMIEAARSMGFAARFASGYLAVPLDDPQEPTSSSGRGSTHAWAQIYLPGAGWLISILQAATSTLSPLRSSPILGMRSRFTASMPDFPRTISAWRPSKRHVRFFRGRTGRSPAVRSRRFGQMAVIDVEREIANEDRSHDIR